MRSCRAPPPGPASPVGPHVAAGAGAASVAALEELGAEGECALAVGDVDGTVAMNARPHAKIMESTGATVLAEPAAQVERRVALVLHAGRPAVRTAVVDRAP